MSDALRVALVHDFVRHGGADKVLEDMHAMWPDAPIYTLYAEDQPQYAGWDVRPSWVQRFLTDRLYRLPFPIYPMLVDRMPRRMDWDVDLLLTSSVSFCKSLEAPEGVPHLCYIYRPAMFAYDRRDSFLAGYPRALRPLLRHFVRRFRRWDQAHADAPDVYVAISHYVADMVRRAYGKEARVVYPGVRIEPCLEAGRRIEPGDHYLCVTRLEAYKRVDLVIEACNRLRLPLKIAGTGPMRSQLERLAGPTVEFLGFVPDEDMPALYAGCKAFLFPSEEDFGIAPVEALAAGRPVIALGRGGPSETVRHGETGVHFAEQRLEDVVGAIRSAEDVRWDAERIRESSRAYSTQAFKDGLRAVAEELVATRGA